MKRPLLYRLSYSPTTILQRAGGRATGPENRRKPAMTRPKSGCLPRGARTQESGSNRPLEAAAGVSLGAVKSRLSAGPQRRRPMCQGCVIAAAEKSHLN